MMRWNLWKKKSEEEIKLAKANEKGDLAAKQKLTEANLSFTWHEFNGQHAFMRDEGERYDPQLALTGYQLALQMFGRTL